ncbi:MAG TPA: CHAT domain-containing protein [Acidobacteriota bacterium]|nr:CHAT domain-containing protein [Acidobacteriota bacterium]
MSTPSNTQGFKRILLAIADQQLGEEISSWLEEGLKTLAASLVIDPVRTEADARKHLEAQPADQPYNLVIAQISIAANRTSPRNDGERRGLELVRSVRRPTASILIAPVVDSRLFDETHDLYKCVPIAADMQLEQRLVKYAQEALENFSGQKLEERVRITFALNTDNLSACSYCIEGIGFSYRFAGSIQMDSRTMEDLIETSKMAEAITEYPHWERNLRRIGEQLVQKLFFDNYMSLPYGKVAGERKTEIVFDTARGTHPVIFEALVDPESMARSADAGGTTFWMLKAPIYRRLRNEAPTDRYPLFQGATQAGPINCLIIEAQVDGLVPSLKTPDGKPLTYQPLPNVPLEAGWLEEFLKANQEKFGLGQILRISSDRLGDKAFNRLGDKSVKDWVRTELSRPEIDWHLVHYAGHCHYDEAGGKAYVLFPGEEELTEALDLGIFSVWLSKTRFVYLSGCNSSEENFVFELANNHVPAVLGFRWKVEDDAAAQYTQSFYRDLFEVHRSLEYAFFTARLQIRDAFARKRIWAAPMLIMQLNNSYGAAA